MPPTPSRSRVSFYMSAKETISTTVSSVMDEFGGDYCRRPLRHSGPKVMREALWGFHTLGPAALSIIDSPYFQRLRNLFQTSLALYTYPSAVHTRFEHSLGVSYTATRMMDAVQANERLSIPPELRLETYFAALMHDISHGPFSHASEDVYGRDPVFNQVRAEEKTLFANASASEIHAWAMLTSPVFRELWKVTCELAGYDLSIDRISSMIMGSTSGIPPEWAFLTDIINGPFDADKLDYLSRDGYFTGLRVSVDVDRLLHGLGLHNDGDGKRRLLTQVASSSALEQLIFAKTQLYNQFYHHQKVRASARLLHQLLRTIRDQDLLVGRRSLRIPASFVALDEYDVLGGDYSHATARRLVRDLRTRHLPNRCLVLTYPTIERSSDSEWDSLSSDWRTYSDELQAAEAEIARAAGVSADEVMIDVPYHDNFSEMGQAVIRLTNSHTMRLQEFFPAAGWAAAHKQYRAVSYVFTYANDKKRVALAARDYLRGRRVEVNDHAFGLAKISL